MRKYEESKITRIMMATVPHVTSGSGLRKSQADGFLFDRVYLPYAFKSLSSSLHHYTHSTHSPLITNTGNSLHGFDDAERKSGSFYLPRNETKCIQ